MLAKRAKAGLGGGQQDHGLPDRHTATAPLPSTGAEQGKDAPNPAAGQILPPLEKYAPSHAGCAVGFEPHFYFLSPLQEGKNTHKSQPIRMRPIGTAMEKKNELEPETKDIRGASARSEGTCPGTIQPSPPLPGAVTRGGAQPSATPSTGHQAEL